jgi:hypothetical protein
MNQNLTIFSIKNSRWIAGWMRQFCNATMMKAANIRKAKGASVSWLLKVLLALPFCNVRIWQFTGSVAHRPCRDTFYRFLSNASYNWRQLLASASQALIREMDRLTGPSGDRVLIIDDSPYKRPRSKAVEYLGRQYDHSSGTFYRGFRLLSAGWSDGHSFVPVEMELLTNATAGKRIGPDPDLDRRTHAGRRCKQACRKATEVALEMIERSQDADLPADYVVFDSWYGHAKLIRRISQHLPVVCMVKNHPNFLYRYGKRIYTLGDLYRKVSGRKRSKPEGPIIGSITALMLGGIRMRLVFVRDQRDPDKWLALASSDLDITPERICRIYAKRWAIEVFFKQIKQQLGLVGQLQARSYTACVAFTSIVFLRYMMLGYYQRQQADSRTIPGLFYAACQQLQAISLQCCLQIILLEIMMILSRARSPQAFETACTLCGVIQQFSKRIYDNSMTFKPLTNNCES